MRPGLLMGVALNGVGQAAHEHADEVALEAAFGFVTGGSSTGFRLVSVIGRHSGIARYASRLSGKLQRSIDHLTGELARGNLNPGIGTKHVFGEIFEARARDGARVYFRNAGEGALEIVGKSDKADQVAVIGQLRQIYRK